MAEVWKVGDWCLFHDTATDTEVSATLTWIDDMTDSYYLLDPSLPEAAVNETDMPVYSGTTSGRAAPVARWTHRVFKSSLLVRRLAADDRPASRSPADVLAWLDGR